MTKPESEDLEGNTLYVYAFVAREGRPVGTREVMRGANLSSTSVAHRQLQKLEEMGLLEKDGYGNYFLKEKTNVSGYLWIGKNMIPRLMFYSFFFIGAFILEIALSLYSYAWGLTLENSFITLIGLTGIAMAAFLIEGFLLLRKTKSQRKIIKK